MSTRAASPDVNAGIITSRRRSWGPCMTSMYRRVPAASTGRPTVREATAHAVPKVNVGPEKTDSSREPIADPLGMLRVRVGVRKRRLVPDDHGRVDRAAFNPRAVAFEAGCCALDHTLP